MRRRQGLRCIEIKACSAFWKPSASRFLNFCFRNQTLSRNLRSFSSERLRRRAHCDNCAHVELALVHSGLASRSQRVRVCASKLVHLFQHCALSCVISIIHYGSLFFFPSPPTRPGYPRTCVCLISKGAIRVQKALRGCV